MSTPNPALIHVDVEAYLRDCPPWDEPIDEALIPDLAAEIAQCFDSTRIYDQIDSLACNLLRERQRRAAINELVDVILHPGDYPSPC